MKSSPDRRDGSSACFHGGAFFEAIGDDFKTLDRKDAVINADVLDAWFPPAPAVLDALQEHLPWLLRTSPPTDAAGLVRTISTTRDVPANSILAGAGSSNLIYLALREWLTPDSRVLLLEPTYGEYAHVCERIIGCQVDRFLLKGEEDYQVDLSLLLKRLNADYDLLVLVNPNNPTGRVVPSDELFDFLRRTPLRIRYC